MTTIKTNKKQLLIIPIIALLVALYLFVTPPAEAAGGIGSVVVSNVTSNSMVVSWGFSTATYTPQGATPYKVCWKVSGSSDGTCRHQPFAFTGNTSYHITGLSDNTEYKIKVKCYCKKNTWLGGTRSRKVGTQKVTTLPSVATSGGSVWIAGSTPTQLSVNWSHTNPGQFAFLRACFRKQIALFPLKFKCRQHYVANNNQPTWGSGNRIGWVNASTWSTNAVLTDLRPCTQYVVDLYGFLQNNTNGTHIGRTNSRTNGVCGLVLGLFRMMLQGDEAIQQDYMGQIEAHYQDTTLFDHLADAYPELHEARAIFLEDGDDDLRDTEYLFIYLDVERTDILTEWQQEDDLQAVGLDIESFMSTNYPEEYQAWAEENTTNDDLYIWPSDEWLVDEGETEIGCAYLDDTTDCAPLKLLTNNVSEITHEELCQVQALPDEEVSCLLDIGGNVIIIWPTSQWQDTGAIGTLNDDTIVIVDLEDNHLFLPIVLN